MAQLIRDDLQRELVFAHAPVRVVSLVPSDSYSLFALGQAHRLVGCTEYCVEPKGLGDRARVVGGTKNVDVASVLDLQPDLVLANKEENTRAQLGDLHSAGVPVLISFPRRVADGIAHLARLARLFGVDREPGTVALLRRGYDLLKEPAPERRYSVFAPIWKDPLMTMNDETYGSDALRWAGGDNVFAGRDRKYPLAADIGTARPLAEEDLGERDTRYPRVTREELETADPDCILLPDEPYAFTAEDARWFSALSVSAARDGRVALCSGKDLFWHGAWSIEGLPRLRQTMVGPVA